MTSAYKRQSRVGGIVDKIRDWVAACGAAVLSVRRGGRRVMKGKSHCLFYYGHLPPKPTLLCTGGGIWQACPDEGKCWSRIRLTDFGIPTFPPATKVYHGEDMEG